MARHRRKYEYRSLSKYIAIASIFLLVSTFLIELPQIFLIIAEFGIIAAFVAFGIEGYNYYRNSIRFVIWALIPILAALFTNFHKTTFLLFEIEIAKLYLLGLFACVFISLYYNRWSFSNAAKILFYIIVVVITSIILVGTIYPDVQYDFGIAPTSDSGGSPLNYNPYQIPSISPTTKPSTIITVPTIPTIRTLPPTPKIVVTHTNPPTTILSANEMEQAIFRLTNAERTNSGISSLAWDGQLAVIAREHSQDMAKNGYVAHINPRGENPTARAIRHGYPLRKELGGGWYSEGIGENIATMSTGGVLLTCPSKEIFVTNSASGVADAMMDALMNHDTCQNDGHRKNILNSQYSRIGIGVAYDGRTYIATQDFW